MNNYLRIPPSTNRNGGAFKIASLYLLIGGLWILFSDKLVAAMVSDPAMLLMLNTLKGWGYIVVTALLLYWLIQRHSSTLHLSEERFATAFRASPSAMAISRLDDGRIIEANDRWQDLLGYSREELVGQSSLALNIYAGPADRQSFVAQIQAQGFVRDFELKLRRKSGEERQVSLSAEMIEINNEAVLLTIITDITERKLAEAALRESEERYRNLFQNNHSVMLLIDPETGGIINANPAACAFYGYTREEITHLKISDINQLSSQQVFEEMERAKREQRQQFFFRHRLANGEVREVEVYSGPIQFHGKPLLYSIIHDITERWRAEEQFRLVVEASPNAFMLINTAHQITLVNARAEALFGYTCEELIGQPVDLLVPPQFRAQHRPYLDPFFAASEARSMGVGRDLVGLRKDGSEVQVEIGLTPLMTSEGTFVLMTIIDITERKRAEEELRQTAAELARSNAELEQFAYVASHDLHEPLRAVAGMLQLLQKRSAGQLDDRSEEFIRHALEGTARMQTLLTDLLAYSRVGTRGQDFHPTDLTALLGDVLANLKVAIQESGTMITHDPLPTVMADHTQLIQLFQNLIGNAIKFRNQSSPLIHIGSAPQNDRWLFAVRDNGIGLEAQYFERIFGVFQRLHTRQEYPGSGIGLAICKKIVERHGGRIWVESAPGQGSTFYFTLPAKN